LACWTDCLRGNRKHMHGGPSSRRATAELRSSPLIPVHTADSLCEWQSRRGHAKRNASSSSNWVTVRTAAVPKRSDLMKTMGAAILLDGNCDRLYKLVSRASALSEGTGTDANRCSRYSQHRHLNGRNLRPSGEVGRNAEGPRAQFLVVPGLFKTSPTFSMAWKATRWHH